MERSITKLCEDAAEAVDKGYNYLIISDKMVDKDNAPIPSLLAMSAVHHHLIHCRKRAQTAIIVESGEI